MIAERQLARDVTAKRAQRVEEALGPRNPRECDHAICRVRKDPAYPVRVGRVLLDPPDRPVMRFDSKRVVVHQRVRDGHHIIVGSRHEHRVGKARRVERLAQVS